MSAAVGDLRSALRALVHAPRHVVLTVLCLALGLGANATMFGVADALFFRAPALVDDPRRVVRVYFGQRVPGAGDITTDLVSYPAYRDIRDGTRSFELVAAYRTTLVSEGYGGAAAKLRTSLVTSTYFRLLRAQPALGRFFSADEGSVGGTPVAVISSALWHGRFGASPGALGEPLHIAGRAYAIIGVAPRGFTGIDLEPVEVWLPLEVAADELIMPGWITRRGGMALSLIGRLKPGVTRAQAEADVTAAHRHGFEGWPEADPSARAELASLLRERGPKRSDEAKVAVWLAGVSIAVLLIAGVNVANLLLVRALRRRREFALRLSLGATRARVARLLIFETVLLVLGGAVVAVAVASAGGRVMHALLLSQDAPRDYVSFPRLGTFTVLAALGVAFLISLPPVWAVARADLTRALRGGAREGTPGRMAGRSVLLVGQVALTVVLLIGAGLFVVSLRNVRALDLGFDPGPVLVVDIDFPGITARRANSALEDALYHRLEEAVSALPGVTSVATSTSIPFGFASGISAAVPGRASEAASREPALLIVASEGYLRTVGLRLRDGRWFARPDYDLGAPVAVVNETMARTYWPGGRAIGQCILAGHPQQCRTVIGVVADTRQTKLHEEYRPQLYLPDVRDVGLRAKLPSMLLVRSPRPRSVAAALRRTVQMMDPLMPYVTVRPLSELIAPKVLPWRLGATVFSIFGVLALTLAVVGLYGTMSYAVSERTHEIGVRIALGAQRADILRLVLRRGLIITAAGIMLGVVAALLGGRAIAGLLFDVSARDLSILGAAGSAVTFATLAASYLPAARATRVDPVEALRAE
ncbi:MAG: ADOP family duplicated permease [Gemmatimonadaceae bacterium]